MKALFTPIILCVLSGCTIAVGPVELSCLQDTQRFVHPDGTQESSRTTSPAVSDLAKAAPYFAPVSPLTKIVYGAGGVTGEVLKAREETKQMQMQYNPNSSNGL
jgi:hypothetical protein